MRITSWNGLCGDVSRRLSDLAPLRSDLITLQECRRPASDSASVIWRGDIPYQGVAVVSTEVPCVTHDTTQYANNRARWCMALS